MRYYKLIAAICHLSYKNVYIKLLNIDVAHELLGQLLKIKMFNY